MPNNDPVSTAMSANDPAKKGGLTDQAITKEAGHKY